MVKDLAVIARQAEAAEGQLDVAALLEMQNLARRVLKIYKGNHEYNFFLREYLSLNKLNSGEKFPGIVQLYDAQVIRRPEDALCSHGAQSILSSLGKRRSDQEPPVSDLDVDVDLQMKNAKLNCGCASLEPIAYMVMEYCPSMDLFTYVAEQVTIGNELLCHALFL